MIRDIEQNIGAPSGRSMVVVVTDKIVLILFESFGETFRRKAANHRVIVETYERNY